MQFAGSLNQAVARHYRRSLRRSNPGTPRAAPTGTLEHLGSDACPTSMMLWRPFPLRLPNSPPIQGPCAGRVTARGSPAPGTAAIARATRAVCSAPSARRRPGASYAGAANADQPSPAMPAELLRPARNPFLVIIPKNPHSRRKPGPTLLRLGRRIRGSRLAPGMRFCSSQRHRSMPWDFSIGGADQPEGSPPSSGSSSGGSSVATR